MIPTRLTALIFRALRGLTLSGPLAYMALGAAPVQPILEWLGRRQAWLVYRRARASCPAYQAFLGDHPHQAPRGPAQLSRLPITDKPGYVQRYSLEQRCYGGRLPGAGTVIDESSGSSGMPNNWVRGPRERAEIRRMLQLSFRITFGPRPYVILNCFALGPWATGMVVSSALADLGILKSIGSDQAKLEHSLALLGPGYRYIIMGYPPFLKQFVDTTRLDLSGYQIAAIVGGEGITEPMRAYLLRRLGQVVSAYGASDLEINIGSETELTQSLRQRCMADPQLSLSLFGQPAPPMIFQYNPLDYLIEASASGDLLFTVCRPESAAPKLRYNLRDTGGTLRYRELEQRLRARGVAVEALAHRRARLPFLYVFGRSDQSVPFYGAKIFPTDLEQVIASDPLMVASIRSFQLHSCEDTNANRRLVIRLEQHAGVAALEAGVLRGRVFDGLLRVNQDFREVARVFPPERLALELYAEGEGPFAGQDARIKRAYIA